MTPPMYQRVRNMFVDAGLTTGFVVQLLAFNDPGDLTKAVMVFRPNGGTSIRNDLGNDNYVLVDLIGAKNKIQDVATAAQTIVDYVQANPHSDECVGKIENMGAIPAPVQTEEGRMVFRLQFACIYGD
ncbi:hypothetical protein ACLBW0_21660 [Enterobacteriaceae bacterium C34A]